MNRTLKETPNRAPIGIPNRTQDRKPITTPKGKPKRDNKQDKKWDTKHNTKMGHQTPNIELVTEEGHVFFDIISHFPI